MYTFCGVQMYFKGESMATFNFFLEKIKNIELEIQTLTDQEKEDFEERAAIMEYEAGMDQKEAEIKALEIIKSRHLKMSA